MWETLMPRKYYFNKSNSTSPYGYKIIIIIETTKKNSYYIFIHNVLINGIKSKKRLISPNIIN